MKNIFYFLILLVITGCSKDDDSSVDNPVEPVPEGAKLVTIIIDPSYDLTQTIAFSITGTSPMSGETKSISIPAIQNLKSNSNKSFTGLMP